MSCPGKVTVNMYYLLTQPQWVVLNPSTQSLGENPLISPSMLAMENDGQFFTIKVEMKISLFNATLSMHFVTYIRGSLKEKHNSWVIPAPAKSSNRQH